MTEAELDRMAAPIGLDLGAVTPEETALSILAEVVAVRNGRAGGRLGDRRPDPRGRHLIAGLVLAAGGSSRFGEPKQLAILNGRPLLEHVAATQLAVPVIERTVVVLGCEAERVRGRANLDGTDVVFAADWSEGISASLRAGVEASPRPTRS